MGSQALLLLDLPPEILTVILRVLPTTSILICQRVNHYLQDLISNSVELQYHIHSGLTAQMDNPLSVLPTLERLSQLRTKNDKWEELSLSFGRKVRVPFHTSGIYDLSAGIYLLGDTSRRALHYMYLPSTPDEEIVWKNLYMEHHIIDMGFCVYEHDLIAVITKQRKTFNPSLHSAVTPNDPHEIRIHLHQVSSGRAHPEAQKPVILVTTLHWERPALGIEIVGDNLVLILTCYPNPSKPDDQVFVYEWKTGKLKMKFIAPYHSYSGLLFLTTETFLLPNTNTGRLEYWRIPPCDPEESSTPRPFFALSLPELSTDATFGHISCRADPNPTTTFLYSSKPFHADPHHAIAIFSLVIFTNVHGLPEIGNVQHVDFVSRFVFFVHRSSLVECMDRFSTPLSPNGEIDAIPYSQWGPPVCRWFPAEVLPMAWITTTAGQRCISMQDMGSEADPAPIILLNFNQSDVAKVLEVELRERHAQDRVQLARERLAELTSHPEPHSQQEIFEALSNLEEAMLQLGLSAEEYNQRLRDLSDHNSDDDFGMESSSNDGSESEDWSNSPHRRPKRVKAITRLSEGLDDPHHCFQNIIYSSLPYTICSSREKYSFHGALLDEDRILGLGLGINPIRAIATVDILYVG